VGGLQDDRGLLRQSVYPSPEGRRPAGRDTEVARRQRQRPPASGVVLRQGERHDVEAASLRPAASRHLSRQGQVRRPLETRPLEPPPQGRCADAGRLVGAEPTGRGRDPTTRLQRAIGRMLAALLLGLAEIENEFRRERQAAGIEQAKKKGKYKGRANGT